MSGRVNSTQIDLEIFVCNVSCRFSNESLEKALVNMGCLIVPKSVKLKTQNRTQIGTFSVRSFEEYLRILRKGTIRLGGFEMTVNISKRDLTFLVRNFKFDQVADENDPHIYEAKERLCEKFEQFGIVIDNVEYDLKSNLFHITFPNLAAVKALFNSNLLRKEKSGEIFHFVFLLGDDELYLENATNQSHLFNVVKITFEEKPDHQISNWEAITWICEILNGLNPALIFHAVVQPPNILVTFRHSPYGEQLSRKLMNILINKREEFGVLDVQLLCNQTGRSKVSSFCGGMSTAAHAAACAFADLPSSVSTSISASSSTSSVSSASSPTPAPAPTYVRASYVTSPSPNIYYWTPSSSSSFSYIPSPAPTYSGVSYSYSSMTPSPSSPPSSTSTTNTTTAFPFSSVHHLPLRSVSSAPSFPSYCRFQSAGNTNANNNTNSELIAQADAGTEGGMGLGAAMEIGIGTKTGMMLEEDFWDTHTFALWDDILSGKETMDVVMSGVKHRPVSVPLPAIRLYSSRPSSFSTSPPSSFSTSPPSSFATSTSATPTSSTASSSSSSFSSMFSSTFSLISSSSSSYFYPPSLYTLSSPSPSSTPRVMHPSSCYETSSISTNSSTPTDLISLLSSQLPAPTHIPFSSTHTSMTTFAPSSVPTPTHVTLPLPVPVTLPLPVPVTLSRMSATAPAFVPVPAIVPASPNACGDV